MELTDRERTALSIIIDTQRTKGFPPSVRELMDPLGCKSPATVHTVLQALVDKGHIVKGSGARQITVLHA